MLRVTVIPYLCTTFSGLCAQKTWKDPEAPRMLCENVGPLTGKLPSGTWWHLTPTTANPEGHGLDSFPLTQGKSGLRTFTLYVPHPHNQYQLGLAPHLFPWISMTSYLTSLCPLEPFLISNHMFLKKNQEPKENCQMNEYKSLFEGMVIILRRQGAKQMNSEIWSNKKCTY